VLPGLCLGALAALGIGAAYAANDAPPRALSGEACSTSGSLQAGETVSVVCGASAALAGTIVSQVLPPPLPNDAQARKAAILSRLTAGDDLTCSGAQWLPAGEQGLMVCSLKSNGWPRIVVGALAGDRLYLAEGLPAALPLLEAALAGGGATQTAAANDAALRVLREKLSPAALKAGAEEYATFANLVERARLDAGVQNYAGAEAAYRQALAVDTELFGADSMVVGQILAELALQVSNQGRFGEAAGLFRRAEPIIEASSDDAERARLASYRALDAANQRNYADALKYARESTAARRAELAAQPGGGDAAAVPVGQGELAHSLRIEAAMALRLGDVASARAAAEEALWIVSQEEDLPLWWRPDTVSLMGEVNAQDGRVAAAEQNFRDARDLDKTLFGDTVPTARADFRLGAFYADQQIYAPALEAYRAGFAILDKQHGGHGEVMPDDVIPFVAAEEAAGEPGARDADIFRAVQLPNAGLADQSIARVAAREAAGNPTLSDLVQQAQTAARERDAAQVELAAEFAKSDDERSGAREEKLENDVKVASLRADELFGKVGQQFPDYSKLVNAGPADLHEVQAQLAPGEALLSYVIGVRSSYAILVTAQGFTAAPLEVKQDDLAGDIADLRSAFVPNLRSLPEFSLKNAHTLYMQLLAPLEPRLAGIDRLVVVPGSTLDNLPFALLVSDAPREGEEHAYSRAAWLIRRMAVSQVPSPRAFLSLRGEARTHQQRRFLGIGDPDFGGAAGAAGAKTLTLLADSCRSDGPIDPALLRALPPLPETAREVKAVSTRFASPTLLLGAAATESNLRAQPLDQYPVLYFATHGVLPGELHCASEAALALSPPSSPAASTAADGLLTASEIAQLKLDADLVVLSACNTANSPTGDSGGALEGLADAFFAAGARGVLASYWQVPSAATEQLMMGVFQNGTEDVAQALRRSQLAVLSQPATAHPFYWAAFSLIGDSATARTANRVAAASAP
jgi:CHAT domain-containing protein